MKKFAILLICLAFLGCSSSPPKPAPNQCIDPCDQFGLARLGLCIFVAAGFDLPDEARDFECPPRVHRRG